MRSSRSKISWSRATLIFGLAFWSGGCTDANKSANHLGTAKYEDLVQRVTVPGVVSANRKTIISAPYNGYIRKIFVHVGQKVQSGDPIVSVVQSLRTNSEEVYPLRAPFSGSVVQVLKTEGEYVDTSGSSQNGGSSPNAIVRIDDVSKLFVEATVPEIEVDKLKVNQEVVIKASALLGRTFQGRIRNIFLAAKEQRDWDRSKVEFTVYIEVVDGDSHLKPGMSVVLDIITNKAAHVLTLRHEFVQDEEEVYFITTEAGKKVKVQVGLQNDELVEIRGGLKEGDRVQLTDFLSLLKGK